MLELQRQTYHALSRETNDKKKKKGTKEMLLQSNDTK